jgi:hypothetical protein
VRVLLYLTQIGIAASISKIPQQRDTAEELAPYSYRLASYYRLRFR